MTAIFPPPQNQQPYSGPYLSGHRPGEQLLAELLRYALDNIRALASDPTDQELPRLLSFYPANVDTTVPDPAPSVQMFRAYLAKTAIKVYDAYPKYEYALPFVAVWPLDEGEAPEQALGDHHLLHVDSVTRTQQELKGQWMDQTVRFMVATDDPQATMLLYRIVWYIIFVNKMDLLSYADMHNLNMRGGQLDFDVQVFPNWQYSRQITITYNTIFDFYTNEQRAPRSVSLSAAAGLTAGAQVVVVPSSTT